EDASALHVLVEQYRYRVVRGVGGHEIELPVSIQVRRLQSLRLMGGARDDRGVERDRPRTACALEEQDLMGWVDRNRQVELAVAVEVPGEDADPEHVDWECVEGDRCFESTVALAAHHVDEALLTSCGDTVDPGHRQVDDPVAIEVTLGEPNYPTAVRRRDERRAERLD